MAFHSPPLTTSKRMLVVLVVLASLAATGDAIHCYVCNSKTDNNCGDPFAEDRVHKMECTPEAVQNAVREVSRTISDTLGKFGVDIPSGTTQIEFICQKVKYPDSKGSAVVMRTCAFSPDTVNSCPPEQTGAQCLQCNSDLCNAAPVAALGAGRLIGLLLLAPAAALRLLRP